MRRCSAFKGAGLAALVLGLATASPAMAELQVIASNVPAYAVGMKVPDNTVFNLKAGERVQVLVLPSNRTQVFEGKGSHTLPDPRGGSRSATKKKQPE